MATWNDDELTRIGDAGEIRIVTRRPDGSPRPPVTIWVVRVGDDLYVRSVRGRYGGWYQGARRHPTGFIRVDGSEYQVRFEQAGPELRDAIDHAYQAKYHRRSPTHVAPIVAPSAAAATLRLLPEA